MGAITVAVLSFDGFGNQDVVIAEAAELSKLLGQSGLTYDQENWFQAGYDPPFRVTGRHNEVWIQIYNMSKANWSVLDRRTVHSPSVSISHWIVSSDAIPMPLYLLFVDVRLISCDDVRQCLIFIFS